MDPIDQRARAARLAVESATAEVTPTSFTPRRSKAAPAIMAAGLLVGGSILATSVLGDSTSPNQQVVTESDVAAQTDGDASAANDSFASAPTVTIPPGRSGSASAEAAEEATITDEAAADGDYFVLDNPPAGLGEPTIFDFPDVDMPDMPFDLSIVVYGTAGVEDPFVNGDLGIMRADGMDGESMDGEPMTVAGREVLVDRTDGSGNPEIIVNWIDEPSGKAVGVATWSLDIEALLPTVELLLEDPTATPTEAADGLVLVTQTDSMSAGLAFMSGAGNQVMYQSSGQPGVGFVGGALSVSTAGVDDGSDFASSWLMAGEAPRIEALEGGGSIVEISPNGDDNFRTTTVRVPHPDDDNQMIVVTDLGSGGFTRDELVAAARSARRATAAEVADMEFTGDQVMTDEGPVGPMAMIEGELADGRSLVVESGPDGICLIKGGVQTEEGCYEFVPPENVDVDGPFALTARSDLGDLLVLPIGEPEATGGSAFNGADRAQVLLANGETVIADTFTATGAMIDGPGAFNWTIELDEMPVDAVLLDASGSVLLSYNLPDLQPEPGRKVTLIGMG